MAAAWKIQRCDKLGRANDPACGRLMGDVQGYCLDPGDKTHSTATIDLLH
jgi:hypothetical protein